MASKNTLLSEKIQGKEDQALDAIPARVSQVIALTALSQTDFAHQLGVSPGFVSDVVRAVKRPGVEFLIGIHRAFRISIDWLLLGEGTMLGGAGIQTDLFFAIRLQVAVVRAAVLDSEPIARALLLLLRDGRVSEADQDPVLRECLERMSPEAVDVDLVVQLYNGHLWSTDPDTQRRNILEAAVAHFQSLKPDDRMKAITGQRSVTTPATQINTGKRQRISGANYFEIKKGRK